MILSDDTIYDLIKGGTLMVEPFNKHGLQAASMDLRLGMHFMQVAPDQYMSMSAPVDYVEHWVQEQDVFAIKPKSFLLATTLEYVGMPSDVTAFVEGRSSIGRMGLFVQNAGWIDCGFSGQITLELFNASDNLIELEVGRRICQLVFARTDQRPSRLYDGKYQNQHGTVGSRIHLDERR